MELGTYIGIVLASVPVTFIACCILLTIENRQTEASYKACEAIRNARKAREGR